MRAQGIDVTTAEEVGLLGAEDQEHLAFATSQKRVMVTQDHDYFKLHAVGTDHFGIAYYHQDKYGIGQQLQMLLLLDGCFEAAEMVGRVEYL